MSILLFNSIAFAQQQKKSKTQLVFSAGLNRHYYTHPYPGWFAAVGAEKKIRKNLVAGVHYAHSSYNNFPNNFHLYNYQPGAERELVDRWIGITKQDWIEKDKGFYHLLTGDIFSLGLGYEIQLNKKLSIQPNAGLSCILSNYHTVGLFDAYFINDILVDGHIGYDLRNSVLTGWSFGFDLNYRFDPNLGLFLKVQDNRDISGEGFNYYEAKQFGLGLKFGFQRR